MNNLIEKAKKLPNSDWKLIDELIEATTDLDEKESLLIIQKRKYHLEEYAANNL